MATCASYNCESLGAYNSTLDNCAPFRTGGTSALVILACDHQITDPTDGTAILAEIAAGRAWLVENIKLGITAPTPVTVDPVTACGTARVISNTFNGTIFDAKVDETNHDFWSRLTAGYATGGILANVCPTDELSDIAIYIDAEVSFGGGLVQPDVNTELIHYEITFSFQKSQYEIVTAPTGVWD